MLAIRWLAFLLFASAAIDWPQWWLDRAGTAALAFGFLALAVGGARGRVAPLPLSPVRVNLADRVRLEQAKAAEALAAELAETEADDLDPDGETLEARIAAYGRRVPAQDSS